MGEDHPKIYSGRRSFAALGEEEIFALARQKMEDEKWFLSPYLTLDIMADQMNVRRNALSSAVNRFAGVNFSRWTNTYRVAEVERLAALPESRDSSTAELALMSGFSNRKSFHRVYTALRHGKPSETLPGGKNRRKVKSNEKRQNK